MDLEVTLDLEESGGAEIDGKPADVSRRSLTTKIRVSPGRPATLSGIARDRVLTPRASDGVVVATKESLTFKVLPQNVTDDSARVQFLVIRESDGVETTLAAPVMVSAMGEKAVLEQKSRGTGPNGALVSVRVSMKPSLPEDP